MPNIASVNLTHDNASRGALARKAAELANATALLCLNDVFTAAGTAIATVATQAKTVNVLAYTVGGAFKSKVATDNFWTLTGATVQANSFQKYCLLINAAGAASVQEGVQSTIGASSVAWTNVSALSPYAPVTTILNAGNAIVATLTIATGAAATFIPGTTALNAAGITATFADGLDASLLPVIANETARVIGQQV